MGVHAFITDLDGTLNFFKIDIVMAWNEITQYLSSADLLDHFKSVYSITDFFKRLYELESSVDRDVFRELRDKIYDIACKYEYEASLNNMAKPYANELLEYMDKQGIRMGVVSNSCYKAVYRSLDILGFRDYFDAIVTRDDIRRIKPYPDPILKILDLLECKRHMAVYLGDSVFDVLAGKAAGVTTIYLNDRELNYSGVLDEKPDYIIYSLKEFLLLWKRHFV